MAEDRAHIPPRDDLALVQAAQSNDYGAFEELVARYSGRVFRLALNIASDEGEAEEITQEAFLNIFRSLSDFREESSLSTWIYRIATNTALMRLRSKRRKPLELIEEQRAEGDEGSATGLWPLGHWSRSPDDQLLSQELSEKLGEAIAELPGNQQVVLLLRDVEGLSNVEVAESLGVSVATVKARLHRSRLYVRDKLERYFNRK